MELRDLGQSELLALVGVIERVVMADKLLNEQEKDFVRWMMEAIGQERYIDTLDELEGRYGEDELRAMLRAITDPDVRELIYGTVLEASTINALVGENTPFMDWLAKLWHLEIRIEDTPDTAL